MNDSKGHRIAESRILMNYVEYCRIFQSWNLQNNWRILAAMSYVSIKIWCQPEDEMGQHLWRAPSSNQGPVWWLASPCISVLATRFWPKGTSANCVGHCMALTACSAWGSSSSSSTGLLAGGRSCIKKRHFGPCIWSRISHSKFNRNVGKMHVNAINNPTKSQAMEGMNHPRTVA